MRLTATPWQMRQFAARQFAARPVAPASVVLTWRAEGERRLLQCFLSSDEDGTRLVDGARRSGLPLVAGATLVDRIRRRPQIYDAAVDGRPLRCFVNVGGATANYGDTEASLEVPNGLVLKLRSLPASPSRGLIFEFAARGLPVVHLLYARGLARENGLPFDPVPFPPPSSVEAAFDPSPSSGSPRAWSRGDFAQAREASTSISH